MLVRFIFAAFVLLALLGDARIFLFIMNRFVYGSHREERSPWEWLMFVVPPLLLALTALFWPLSQWIERLLTTPVMERITPERIEELAWSLLFAKIGVAWLIAAACVGSYWLLDRLRVIAFGEPPIAGIREGQPELIRHRHSLNQLYDLEVTRYEIIIDDLPPAFDGYRIAFLTDTHVASFVRRAFYREILAQTALFDPDVILLGGDFVSFRRHIPLMADVLIGELRARDGVFAVLGNHDYWAGPELVREALRSRGVTLLENASVMLHRDDATLPLAGIDEIYRGAPDADAAFRNVDPASPAIAFSHHPDVIDLLGGRRIDLLLCGHTHGGQIRFPFFGAVVVPSRHEGTYASGFHRIGAVLMYVSRGIGAIPPVRILCRPEIATFVLRRGHRR